MTTFLEIYRFEIAYQARRLVTWVYGAGLFAVGFLIAGPAGETVLPGTVALGIGLLWAAAILTIYTGWDYFRSGLHHIIEEP